jgi:hypothetical protein
MPSCPRCRQSVTAQAVTCPHCRISLKAYGHPGIPLHRAAGTAHLCESCAYHKDDSCNYPQRPQARECTLYQDVNIAALPRRPHRQSRLQIKGNEGWWILAGLAALSLLIALANRSGG